MRRISYWDLIKCLYFAEDFILRFNNMFLLCRYHWKRGLGVVNEGWKIGWRQGYFTDNSNTLVSIWVFGCHLLEHKHNLVFTHPSGRYYWRGVVSTIYPLFLILCEFFFKILRKKSFMGFPITKFAKNNSYKDLGGQQYRRVGKCFYVHILFICTFG